MEKKIKDIVTQFIHTSMSMDEFKRKLIQLKEAKPKQEWYAIPPYDVSNDGWRIFNEKGEFVATFEEKEECLLAVKLFNENKKQNGKTD